MHSHLAYSATAYACHRIHHQHVRRWREDEDVDDSMRQLDVERLGIIKQRAKDDGHILDYDFVWLLKVARAAVEACKDVD